jgi:hypothetical protein
MSLDERVTALEVQFEKTADLFDRLLTVVESNQKRLLELETPKVTTLNSQGQRPKKVSKEPGDREH